MASIADTSSYNQPAQPDAMGVAQNALGVAQGAQNLKAGQFDLINKQYGVMHNILGSMVSDPDLTTDKMMGGISQMAKLGLITPQMAATEGSSVFQTGGDAAKLKSLAMSHLQQSMSGAQQFQNQYGQVPVSTPGGTSFQRQNLVTNSMTPTAGGTFANGLSPGEATTPTQIGTDAQGRAIMGTRPQFVQRAGGNNALMNPPLGAGTTPGIAPPQQAPGQGVAMPQPNALGVQPPMLQAAPQTGPAPSPAPTNALGAIASAAPPQGRAPVAPPITPPQAAPPAQGGGIVMGLPVGAGEAAARTLSAGADQGSNLQAQAGAAPQRKATLSTMESLLPNITTGPNAENINTLKSGANVITGMLPGAPALFDKQKIAAQAEFDKSAALLQSQQAVSLGGTDAGKTIAGNANPNSHTSNEGNLANIQILKGNEDAINAKNSAWQAYKQANGQGADFGAFENAFNQTYSPRAYQFPYMTPSQRTALFASMSPAERQQVQGAIENAEAKGYIKAPSK